MPEDKIKKIFAKNLKYYMNKSEKTQADLYRYIGVSSSVASAWCNGLKLPRMDKIQSIANWLNVSLSDLLEENKTNDYYLNPETKKIAQEVYQNPELQILFDASKNASPEDLKLAAQMLERMKKGDDPGDD